MSQPNAPVGSGAPNPEYPQTIISPIDRGHDLIVSNVYELPHGDGEPCRPDVDSHYEFTEYAESRFDPRSNGSEPTLVVEPTTYLVPRTRRGEGWVGNISPRLSVGFFLATTVLHTLVGNWNTLAADAREEYRNFLHNSKQAVSQWLGFKFEPTTISREIQTAEPGSDITLDQIYAQPVGESAPSKSDITKLVEMLGDEQTQGNQVTKISIFAGSSDEWGPNESSLQKPDAQNDELDGRRAADAAQELKNQLEAAGLEVPDIETASAEGILTAGEVAKLEAEASRHELTLEQAIHLFNSGGELPASLQTLLQTKLGDARSVLIRIQIQEADQMVTKTLAVRETMPDDQDRDYALYWGLPLPFFPRLRREGVLKPGFITWTRPGAKPDRRWVELYKEAMQEDGSLPRDAWRYTRKYQLLAREDRIDYVLTHRYTDANGEERDLRVMFVDHDPTDETVDMFKYLLTAVSQMNDSKVAERWSAVTVFPRAQVGIEPTAGRSRNDRYPHHPADIGLDIDKQDPEEVLGIAMPALGLVEMHMPEDPSHADLHNYMGSLWVAAHELAGHATDTTDEPRILTPVGAPEFRHYTTNDVWANGAAEEFKTLPKSDARGERVFDVTWRPEDGFGNTHSLRDRVRTRSGDDTLLRVSHGAELQGRKPTRYAGGSPEELYAETAGQLVSGAPIPFTEAGLSVRARIPGVARGYAVGDELRRMFAERTGWSPNAQVAVNDEEFTLIEATDDPMLGPWIDEARRTPMPNDRITILTGVASLADSDKE